MHTYMQQLPLAQEARDAISYLPSLSSWHMMHLLENGIQGWHAHSCAEHEPTQLDDVILMWGMSEYMM